MSFMKPSALYMFLITYVSFRWMPCQSWGFLRWPGLDGFLRLLVVVLLWSMFSEIRYITSNSMHPTLREHDRVIIEKASYYIRSPAVHDIVTFQDPTQQLGDKEEIVFIKRIVAKAGDLVQVWLVNPGNGFGHSLHFETLFIADWTIRWSLYHVNGGCLYVNGIAQNEDFIAERPRYESNLTYVPKGHVYVLGDNRNKSYDSHDWGPLLVKNIVGRYVMCCYRPSES